MSEAQDLALPAVVDEKYRVGDLVGEGAMGRVYKAEHLLLGHRVAIKFLRTSVDTETVRSRFIREAKATMALRSEHIVRVFDLGVLPSKTPYMVLEYLEGIDLRSLLDEQGSLPVEEAVDYALQACEALAEAHVNGIVHRDLKPHNLFRTRLASGGACIKLLDFGVSKFEEQTPDDHELTTSQVLLGSPAFMSPEQIRSSSRVDARADVWSLGIVLYMLLGGGKPFVGDGLTSLCASIMVDPPRPLADRCPGVPKELEVVIFRCLEKSRDLRMASVADLARALAPFASADGRLRAEHIGRTYGSLLQRAASPPSESVASTPVTTAEASASAPTDPTSADARLSRTSADGPGEGTSTALATKIEPVALAAEGGRRAPRGIAFAVIAAVAVVLLVAAATATVRRSQPSSPPPAVVAALPPEAREAPTTTEPAAEPPPALVSAALHGASDAPAPKASSRPPTRRVVPSRRAPAPKHAPQVDRNGVPILE